MKKSDEEVRKAIEVVIEYLDDKWIGSGCLEYSFGCGSCQASALKKDLQSISVWVQVDDEEDKSNE